VGAWGRKLEKGSQGGHGGFGMGLPALCLEVAIRAKFSSMSVLFSILRDLRVRPSLTQSIVNDRRDICVWRSRETLRQ
jgi:hypothetical protein